MNRQRTLGPCDVTVLTRNDRTLVISEQTAYTRSLRRNSVDENDRTLVDPVNRTAYTRSMRRNSVDENDRDISEH